MFIFIGQIFFSLVVWSLSFYIGPLAKSDCSKIFGDRGCNLCLKVLDSANALNEHKQKCCLTAPVPLVSTLYKSIKMLIKIFIITDGAFPLPLFLLSIILIGYICPLITFFFYDGCHISKFYDKIYHWNKFYDIIFVWLAFVFWWDGFFLCLWTCGKEHVMYCFLLLAVRVLVWVYAF